MECFNATSSSLLSKNPTRLQPRSCILSVNTPCRCTYPRANETLQPDARGEITHGADEVNRIRVVVYICTHDPSQPAHRWSAKGESKIQEEPTHIGALRYLVTSLVSRLRLYPTNPLIFFSHAAVSVVLRYPSFVGLCRPSRW